MPSITFVVKGLFAGPKVHDCPTQPKQGLSN
jgi:hypothetical protein